MDDKENWIGIANRFANQGDFRGMRASAKEILQIVQEDADAYAIMAEASFYMDEREQAKEYMARAEEREPGNLRARLVRAAFFSADFALEEEIKELLSIVQATEKVAESLWTQSLRYVRFKALAWLSDAWLLAAEPEFAMNTLLAASDMLTGEEAAECYSKALFCSNYRTRTPAESLRLHRGYEKVFEGVKICHPYRTEAAEAGALQPKAALSVGEAMAAARAEPMRQEMKTLTSGWMVRVNAWGSTIARMVSAKGMPRARARMAVWEVGPPSEVMKATTFSGLSRAVSAGARSLATRTKGSGRRGMPGMGESVRTAMMRSRTSATSRVRSAM